MLTALADATNDLSMPSHEQWTGAATDATSLNNLYIIICYYFNHLRCNDDWHTFSCKQAYQLLVLLVMGFAANMACIAYVR